MAQELEDARSELENRKVVERAKGILMRLRGISEAEAYVLLRKTAMNQNRKVSDIAQSLTTAAIRLAASGHDRRSSTDRSPAALHVWSEPLGWSTTV